MPIRKLAALYTLLTLCCIAALPAAAQSFRVQCPTSTITHPVAAKNNLEPAYIGPTYTGANGYPTAPANVNGAIKCQQISGGDGYATMGDGTQTYMFSFGPLSGLADIANGKPGTQFPTDFNTVSPGLLVPGDPATSAGGTTTGPNGTPIGGPFNNYNGAVGLAPDADCLADNASNTTPCGGPSGLDG